MLRFAAFAAAVFLIALPAVAVETKVPASAPAAAQHGHDHSHSHPEADKSKAVKEQLAPRPKAKSIMPANLTKIQDTDVVIGNEKAPVTIIEYASFSCVHCANFNNEVFPKIKEKFIDTGKARLIFRSYPLNEPALRASMLVECAPKEQKAGYIKTLFKTVDKWAFEKDFMEKLKSIAKIGGFSDEQFDKCMKNKKVEEDVLADQLIASKQLEIASTPTFYINGNFQENLVKEKFIEQIQRYVDNPAFKPEVKADVKTKAQPANTDKPAAPKEVKKN